MKKIIAMLLAIVMVCALSVSAFAAVNDANLSTDLDDINVTGAYVKETREQEYHIDITWEDMTFTYTEDKDEWNEDAGVLDWTSVTTGSWNKTTATITVTNRSSVAVDADFVLTDAQDDATLSLNATELNLEVGLENDYTGTVTLTVGGSMDEESATALGSIAITLTDAN